METAKATLMPVQMVLQMCENFVYSGAAAILLMPDEHVVRVETAVSVAVAEIEKPAGTACFQ